MRAILSVIIVILMFLTSKTASMAAVSRSIDKRNIGALLASNSKSNRNLNQINSVMQKGVASGNVKYNISDLRDVYAFIKKAMKDGESTITFNTSSASKISFTAFSNIVDKVVNENSEIRYFNKWNTSYTRLGNNGSFKVVFSLNFSRDRIIAMEKEVDQKIRAIVSNIIKPNMNEYDKELALHDYLVNNSDYDYKNLINNTIPNISYTAYGVLIKGVGVCEGYAYAMKRLLNAVGIQCIVVSGRASGQFSGPHAWNIVKLGNNYYHLDATFDDPIVNGGSENELSHKYFNLSDSEMARDHEWDFSKYPKCNVNNLKHDI